VRLTVEVDTTKALTIESEIVVSVAGPKHFVKVPVQGELLEPCFVLADKSFDDTAQPLDPVVVRKCDNESRDFPLSLPEVNSCDQECTIRVKPSVIYVTPDGPATVSFSTWSDMDLEARLDLSGDGLQLLTHLANHFEYGKASPRTSLFTCEMQREHSAES
jgi:hypothetical protein